MKEKYYKRNNEALEKLKDDLRAYAKNKSLEFQEENDQALGWAFQMKKSSKETLGVLSKALTVTIKPLNDEIINIAVGEAKWASKITGGLVGLLGPGVVLGVILIPLSVVGAFKQQSLKNDIDTLIKIRFPN